MNSTTDLPGPITRWLAADHARLDGLLQRAARSLESGAGGIDLAPYDEFRRGLLRHIGIEEKLLLPVARQARGGEPLPVADRLRLDHSAITALLVPTPTPAILKTLVAILEKHNDLEEGPDGVYETCDALLGPKAESLVREMEAFPGPPVSPNNDNPSVMPALRRTLERAGYRLFGENEA